jgi:ABC-type nickel/cobalt efflux system permease component RcnA
MKGEPFSLLRCISWLSHGILSLIIFALLFVVGAFFIHYLREENWLMTGASLLVFGFGVTVFINAWRLRLERL